MTFFLLSIPSSSALTKEIKAGLSRTIEAVFLFHPLRNFAGYF
jgi:hypothetical protein